MRDDEVLQRVGQDGTPPTVQYLDSCRQVLQNTRRFREAEVSYRGRCSLGRLTGSVAPLIMQVVVRRSPARQSPSLAF